MAALLATSGGARHALADDDDGRNRMLFEPGAKSPAVHEDAEGNSKPVDTPAQNAEAASDGQTAGDKADDQLALPPRLPKNLPPRLARTLDVFYGQLTKGNIDGAYSTLTANTVIESDPTNIANLKEKTAQALKLFGSIKGYEIIDVEEVGHHLLGVTCISLGDLYPLRWKFFYYKPDSEWRLIDIRVDDGLADLFPDNERSDAESRLQQP